jgi:hypothetical protein
MREAIKGVIRGRQRSSEVIRGHAEDEKKLHTDAVRREKSQRQGRPCPRSSSMLASMHPTQSMSGGTRRVGASATRGSSC